ncbi:MAG: hypothetical protein WBB01_24090 [Phormidesmis sp.]
MATEIQRINPSELGNPSGYGFTNVVLVPAGKTLVSITGQGGTDAQSHYGNFETQLKRAFASLRIALAAAGANLEQKELRPAVAAPARCRTQYWARSQRRMRAPPTARQSLNPRTTSGRRPDAAALRHWPGPISGELAVEYGGDSLYMTNLLGITLACMVVFLVTGYTSLRRGAKALRRTAIFTGVLVIPLAIGYMQLWRQIAITGEEKPTPKQVMLLEDFVVKETGQRFSLIFQVSQIEQISRDGSGLSPTSVE